MNTSQELFHQFYALLEENTNAPLTFIEEQIYIDALTGESPPPDDALQFAQDATFPENYDSLFGMETHEFFTDENALVAFGILLQYVANSIQVKPSFFAETASALITAANTLKAHPEDPTPSLGEVASLRLSSPFWLTVIHLLD